MQSKAKNSKRVPGRLLRSVDGGVKWKQLKAPRYPQLDYNGHALVFDPVKPSTVLMIAANGATLGSLYRSTDAGLSWKRVRPAGELRGGSSTSSLSRATGARSRSCASATASAARSSRSTAARSGTSRRPQPRDQVAAGPSVAARGQRHLVPAGHEWARLLATRGRGPPLGRPLIRALSMAAVEDSEQAAGLRRYGDVLRAPGVGRIAAAALLARLPSGMAPLATVLLVRGEGRSYGVAGVVIAASSLAGAIGFPLWGRLIDRTGQARVLLPLAVAYPAALAGLALSATQGAPALVLAAFAALAGGTQPPVGASMRALWPSLLGKPGLRDTAYALEAWLQELFFICGPLIVVAIASVAPAWAALVAAAAFAGIGTSWFALAPPVRAAGGSDRAPSRAGALGSKAVRTVLITCVALGARSGSSRSRCPHSARRTARARRAASRSRASPSARWSAACGSAPARRRAAWGSASPLSLALLAVALIPPLVAPKLPVMCALMLLAGMPIAPAFAASYGLVGEFDAARYDERGVRLAHHGHRHRARDRDGRRRLCDRAPRADGRDRAGGSLRRPGGARRVRPPCVAGDPGAGSVTRWPARISPVSS